jgi:hypothetical protein
MALRRIMLALLLSLITAFAPVVSVAMTKACAMTEEKMAGDTVIGEKMSVGNPLVCPCHAMPSCGSMPQCGTTIGCANHCFLTSAILINVAGPFAIPSLAVSIPYNISLNSLLIKPPTPPPRA